MLLSSSRDLFKGNTHGLHIQGLNSLHVTVDHLDEPAHARVRSSELNEFSPFALLSIGELDDLFVKPDDLGLLCFQNRREPVFGLASADDAGLAFLVDVPDRDHTLPFPSGCAAWQQTKFKM